MITVTLIRGTTFRVLPGGRGRTDMTVLLWLLIPLAGTLAALAWMSMRTRPRRPTTATEGMHGMARFREAMERPLPPRERPRSAPSPRSDSRRVA